MPNFLGFRRFCAKYRYTGFRYQRPKIPKTGVKTVPQPSPREVTLVTALRLAPLNAALNRARAGLSAWKPGGRGRPPVRPPVHPPN